MKNVAIVGIIVGIMLYGCSDNGSTYNLDTAPTYAKVTVTYDTAGSAVYFPDQGADDGIALDLELGSAQRDVYFVITNTNTMDTTQWWPSISGKSTIALQSADTRFVTTAALPERPSVPTVTAPIRGLPEATDFLHHLPALPLPEATDKTLSATDSYVLQTAPVEGDNQTFYPGTSTAYSLTATCRTILTADGKTLNVWVADNVWSEDGCTKSRCITQEMVDGIAGSFLVSGVDNDVRDWVSNIYGEEWEDTSISSLIGDDDSITILLLDIDDDDSDSGGMIGYFHSKDNFTQATVPASNERIMFYLDAVMLANPGDDEIWTMTDYFAEESVLTLAHEYQHMINFYQKVVKNGFSGGYPDDWLNEMCSMMSEEFVAKKLQLEGPRGVAYDDGTAGSSNNPYGQLPRFNNYNDISLTQWYDGDSDYTNTLNSYAIVYAFGAYLARNYGGAELFHEIVSNNKTDYTAVETALASLGTSVDFATLLTRWGAAVLLSDEVNATQGYRYNQGEFFSSIYNGITYEYGSINLYQYYPSPWLYGSTYSWDGTYATAQRQSNVYYHAGSNLTGSQSFQITLQPGYRLSVVVK